MENEQSKLNIEFSYLPVVNFAMQQNRVSVIRDFSMENLTEEILIKNNICNMISSGQG
ncbi:hypothetical protein [Dysgonomonas sp.]